MIPHQAISASAGSGKTFQLAHRYIRLLAMGVPPDRVIALTFSRKAAGEIFDAIVEHLLNAARSEEAARAAAARMALPELTKARFLGLLRVFLDGMARMHIGTLDSFTVGVVKMFPMELGLGTDFDVMDNDGDAAGHARAEVLAHMFSPRRRVDPKAQSAFREAFKQATFGEEEKNLTRSLEYFFGDYQGYYRLLPDAEGWGHAKTIWPAGSPWLAKPGKGVDVEKLLESLAASGCTDAALKRWRDFAEAAMEYGHGSRYSKDLSYLLEKLLPLLPDLRAGKAAVKLNRTEFSLTSSQCRQVLALVQRVMHFDMLSALERTRGLHRILDLYETHYDQLIRRRGRLTFDDAQYLLTGVSWGCGGSGPSDESVRLQIDYRLNSRLDHWLLDEFQDTSDLQWEVLRNLADEILQDDSGERSFFYVGDIKQAIYAWRGGNAELFGKILRHYGEAIEESVLSTSYRSCPPVIETVNRTFGQLPDLDFPKGTVEGWSDIWADHVSAENVRDTSGCAMLLEPPCPSGGKPTKEDRFQAVADLLKELDPVRRGLSVAVLVHQNQTGHLMVDTLRRECPGLPVAHEGRAAIMDNPVVALLLALVTFATHPGDTLAWRHLQMSPLATELDRRTAPLALLRQIQSDGFRAFFRFWGRRLDAIQSLDDFGRRRWRELMDAAGDFDAAGSRDGSAFIRFMENYELHESAAEGAVRVMTVYQAKGLGFDVVILPELQNRSIVGAGKVDFVVARDEVADAPAWALRMPRRVLAERDDVLADQLRVKDERSCFEALCVLYVAMTRAKRGLYMVTSFPGKASKAVNEAALLKKQLGGETATTITLGGNEYDSLFCEGRPDWYRECKLVSPPEVKASAPEPGFVLRAGARKRLSRLAPSAGAVAPEAAGMVLGTSVKVAFELGTAVHELFEHVAWSDDLDTDAVVNLWTAMSGCDESCRSSAVEHFRKAVANEAVRDALARPEGDVELWRERAFDLVLDECWVTGVFDRVVLERDGEGRPCGATILDYKTNAVTSEEEIEQAAEHYRPQLALYGKALARLVGLEPEAIRLCLLFTGPGRVVELAGSGG